MDEDFSGTDNEEFQSTEITQRRHLRFTSKINRVKHTNIFYIKQNIEETYVSF